MKILYKTVGLLKEILYFIIYGKKISFGSIPSLEKNVKLIIKKGNMNVGKGVHIRSNSYLSVVKGGRLLLDDSVFINRNCSIVCQNSITIGKHCALSPNVIIYDHDHCFNKQGIVDGYKTEPIVIEDNCWLGSGVIVLRGTHIGQGSVIGAGTVLKGNIPPHSIVTSKQGRELKITPIVDR